MQFCYPTNGKVLSVIFIPVNKYFDTEPIYQNIDLIGIQFIVSNMGIFLNMTCNKNCPDITKTFYVRNDSSGSYRTSYEIIHNYSEVCHILLNR